MLRVFIISASSYLLMMAQSSPVISSINNPELGFVHVDDEICLAIKNDDTPAHSALGTRGLYTAPPLLRVQKDKRRDVSAFGVSAEDGSKQTIADHKGKILVLCFWNMSCKGSLRALKSMKHFQAEEKRGDLLIWPIHAESWTQVLPFFRVRTPEYEGIKIFQVGVGANGRSVLGDMVIASPMIYIIDRNGKIAASYSGYRSNVLPSLLNDYYMETD
jgi:hypothetical protein